MGLSVLGRDIISNKSSLEEEEEKEGVKALKEEEEEEKSVNKEEAKSEIKVERKMRRRIYEEGNIKLDTWKRMLNLRTRKMITNGSRER